MKCPKCKASVAESELQFDIGICGDCKYQIWKKRIPGKTHVLSLLVGALLLLTFAALNFIPWPSTQSTANGFENSNADVDEIGEIYPDPWTSYGVPFLVRRRPPYTFTVNRASIAVNAACAFAVAWLGWAMTLGFFRHVWFQHHFAIAFEDEVDDLSLIHI